jgi:DNA-directed RNA polymerase specialized sigma24 family protein
MSNAIDTSPVPPQRDRAFSFPIRCKRAAEALMTAQYAIVWRVAHGLCGEGADRVARRVLVKSLGTMERFTGHVDAGNWYLHHTILESRHLPRPAVSWPWPGAEAADLQAFFKVFGGLPFQQREAFLLTRGEHLELRATAIAMDCSTTAAQTHLTAAEQTLKKLTGDGYDELLARFISTYRASPPPGDLVIAGAARRRGRNQFWRMARRIFWIVLAAGVIFAVARMVNDDWRRWPFSG